MAPSFALRPAFGVHPYPEWRVDVVRRALRAGVGDVGSAMDFLMWGNDSNGDEAMDSLGGKGTRKPKWAVGREAKRQDLFDNDGSDDSYYGDVESEEDMSEAEWEGWMGDLERQGHVAEATKRRENTRAASGSGHNNHRYADQHRSTQREFQEEKRALEPSAVVTSERFSTAGNYSSQSSTLTLFPPSNSGGIMGRSTSTSQLLSASAPSSPMSPTIVQSTTWTRSRSVLRHVRSGFGQPSVRIAEEN